MYLKVETDDKNKIVELLSEIIEQGELHRVTAQKLDNGNYHVEIIERQEEPEIISS